MDRKPRSRGPRSAMGLKEAEGKFRHLVEDISDGYVVLRGERVVFANKRSREIVGYDLEKAIGQPFTKFLAPEMLEKAMEVYQRSMRGEPMPERLEWVLLRQDGTRVPVEISYKDILYEGKRAVSHIIRDITERKRAEEEILQRSRQLEALHAIGQVVSQTLDLQELLDDALAKVLEVVGLDAGAIYFIDTEAREIFLKVHRGMSEEFVGAVGRLKVGEEDIRRWQEERKPAFGLERMLDEATLAGIRGVIEREGMLSYVGISLQSKDMLRGAMLLGSRAKRWFSPEDLELLEAIGNQIAVAIENAELFEQTRAGAEELRASEERLRALIENAPDAIFVHDLEAKFIDGNKRAEEMIGYSREEVIGRSFLEIGLLPEEYLPKAMEALEKSLKGETSGPDEFELIRKDGSRVSVEITSISMERGGKVEVIGIARDITERKRAEKALQKQTHDLGERVKELNCLYGISSLAAREGITLEEILRGTVDLIPPGWQYPEITCVRITLDRQQFRTKKFRETIWKQTADVIVRADRIGAVEVYYLEEKPELEEGPFLKEERSLINAIAERLGGITERKRVEEEILRHTERLAVTAELTRIIVSSLNIEDVYEAFAAEVRRLVDFDRASIALVEGDKLRFLAVSSEVETGLGSGVTIPLKDSVADWVGAHKRTNIERDFAQERQFPIDETFLKEGLRSAIRLPLFSKGEVFGTFNLISRHPNAYGEREQEILEELAGQIAVAIENDRLYGEAKQRREELETAYQQLVETAAALERGKQELEDSYLKMARTLVLTLEARDPYTRGHSDRVAQISRQTAFEMGLSQEEMRRIETAARLHDLGKIGIPDGILLKPGAITPSERVEIQLHPTRAVELLRFLGFLDGTLPMIEHHHERYNGGGYPNSLKGEETPLGARILCVADAYDAMTSARPYRPAMTNEQAVEILKAGAGTQWDPDVVEAFLRAFGD